MASRLTGAAGRGGARPCCGHGVIKGCVFTNATPRHIKPGRRRPLDPGSAAPTTATCAEPGSTHKAGHHGVLARNTTPLFPTPTPAPLQHHPPTLLDTVWNRKYSGPTPHTPCTPPNPPNPPFTPLHQPKGMPLNAC